ncbi:MAG: hypothetical protein JRI95_07615 [Deltaproteobacteria bacterium]|nr:hypothetical protein [Deltaproteobacteria bacterium]
MELNTAAAVISYISKIEQESAQFYEEWANKHKELKEAFLAFAKENHKNEKNIKRAYYGAVTDALETGFSFKGLEGALVMPLLDNNASSGEVLKASLDLENGIREFYLKAAELSKALLGDVSRAMARVAKIRNTRLTELRLLLEEIQ